MGSSTNQYQVIIVGAGMSGISAAKILSDNGITNIKILEAVNRIGGRMSNREFAGVQVETGANWVEGVGSETTVNPIWTMVQEQGLKTFLSDFDNYSTNTYTKSGLADSSEVDKVIEVTNNIIDAADEFSSTLEPNGLDDISIMAFQRYEHEVPKTAIEMGIDFTNFDYEFGEAPRLTSLQNTHPLPTFEKFGEDFYFVADNRGYRSLVVNLASQFLKVDEDGNIIDERLSVGKAVNKIQYTTTGVTVTTEDNDVYTGDYVMLSVSLGVLQSKLITFEPELPIWKNLALAKFDMGVYTKIFLQFPSKFWPDGEDNEFFLYASDRRGYYPAWQQFEKQYPGANVLMVTVTDMESKRIEQQLDSVTKAEIVEVLKDMFGTNIPDPVDIYVPRWWSNRFFRGSFSNWPIGVNKHEYEKIQAPVGRVYFTGEHTSELFSGYVHGAYLAGIDSANVLIKSINEPTFKFKVSSKNLIGHVELPVSVPTIAKSI